MPTDVSEPFIDPLVGTTVGSYAIQERIGEGGMCVVYRAVDGATGDVAALKILRRQWIDDSRTAKRFLREARISASLTNPNTVAIHEFGETPEGTLYIAMELLRGESLAALLHTPVDPVVAARIAEQVCLSLVEAHGKGVVHRDLKPENIFVSTAPNGQRVVKVLDYGLARVVEAAGEVQVHTVLTQIGTIMGTPSYMSPEQARGDPVDVRTDLYSLGVVLFEMLMGHRPFVDRNPQRVLEMLKHDPLPSLDGMPPELATLVHSLLAKDPEHRPADAATVQGVLHDFLDRSPARASWDPPVGAARPLRDFEATELDLAMPLGSEEIEIVVEDEDEDRPPVPLEKVVIRAAREPVAAPRREARLEDEDRRPVLLEKVIVRELVSARTLVVAPPREARPRLSPLILVAVSLLVLAAIATTGTLLLTSPRRDAPAARPAPAEPEPEPATSPPTPAIPQEPPPGETPAAMVFEEGEDATIDPWAGTFQCDHGPLRLVRRGDRVSGFFGTRSELGRLWGGIRGDTLEFRWALSRTDAADDETARGRGVLHARIDDEGVHLDGTFGYRERTTGGGTWTAVRPR